MASDIRRIDGKFMIAQHLFFGILFCIDESKNVLVNINNTCICILGVGGGLLVQQLKFASIGTFVCLCTLYTYTNKQINVDLKCTI